MTERLSDIEPSRAALLTWQLHVTSAERRVETARAALERNAGALERADLAEAETCLGQAHEMVVRIAEAVIRCQAVSLDDWKAIQASAAFAAARAALIADCDTPLPEFV